MVEESHFVLSKRESDDVLQGGSSMDRESAGGSDESKAKARNKRKLSRTASPARDPSML